MTKMLFLLYQKRKNAFLPTVSMSASSVLFLFNYFKEACGSNTSRKHNIVIITFMLLQKSYETKQYKKGLKAADSILKKFPNHGGE